MSGIESDQKGDGHTSRLVPIIQALAILTTAGLAAFDLTKPNANVPTIVYGIVAAIAIGVDPGSLWTIFKGGK